MAILIFNVLKQILMQNIQIEALWPKEKLLYELLVLFILHIIIYLNGTKECIVESIIYYVEHLRHMFHFIVIRNKNIMLRIKKFEKIVYLYFKYWGISSMM